LKGKWFSNYQCVQQHHNLIFTPTICKSTINEKLVWEDFKVNYDLILDLQGKKIYALDTYLTLTKYCGLIFNLGRRKEYHLLALNESPQFGGN
jgi:hypothetical protein